MDKVCRLDDNSVPILVFLTLITVLWLPGEYSQDIQRKRAVISVIYSQTVQKNNDTHTDK